MNEREFSSIRNPKIAHLSDKEINNLIDGYYAGIQILELNKKFHINTKGNSIVRYFPPIILRDKFCIYCNINLWKRLESKNLINERNCQNKSYCSKCGHKDGFYSCDCYNCLEKTKTIKIIENRKRNDVIRVHFDLSSLVPIKLKELSLIEKIYLGTIVRVGLSEDLKYLQINNSKDYPIAPSIELFNEIILLLIGKKIIVIHPDTLPDSFSDMENLNNSKIDYNKAIYHINVEAVEFESTVDLILNPILNSEDMEEVFKIWKKIAIEECKSYLKYSLNYVDFPYNVGEKSHLMFEKFMENFSVSQIFGLINRCLGYTTKEFQAGKLSRQNSGAYLLGACQHQWERAILKNWDLSNYFRPKELPESVLSMFFFNRVIKIGEKGFTTVPSLSTLNEYNGKY